MSVLQRLISSVVLAGAMSLLGLVTACRDVSPPPDSITAPPAAATSAQAPRVTAGRLRVAGTQFTAPDGSAFQWRGITAFRLVDYVADGQEDADREVPGMGRETRRDGRARADDDGRAVRPPARGRPARAAAGARARGEARPLRRGGRVRRHCRHSRSTFRSTSMGSARSSPRTPTPCWKSPMSRCIRRSRAEVQKPAVSEGAGRPCAVGHSGCARIDRARRWFWRGRATSRGTRRASRARAGGRTCSRWRQGADLLARWKKPVVSDEPIGAGAAFQPGRRDDAPARFRAAALLTRLVGPRRDVPLRGGPAGPRSGRPASSSASTPGTKRGRCCRPMSSTGGPSAAAAPRTASWRRPTANAPPGSTNASMARRVGARARRVVRGGHAVGRMERAGDARDRRRTPAQRDAVEGGISYWVLIASNKMSANV